jgi:competence protein ComEC
VRVPASIVAIPLLVGSSVGILLADNPDPWLPLCAAFAAALALTAALGFFSEKFAIATAAAIAAGCFLSGLSLGLSSARAAYRPDLLAHFDDLDPVARDAPQVLEGVLREDAAPSPAGVSLAMDVHAIIDNRHGRRRETSGGIRLTVGGIAAADLLNEWRAGRTICVPALLRKPTSYGDPGLSDDVRALARRGVVLLGTVKSGSLVEVLAGGTAVQEAAASARQWSRLQLARSVGRWSRESGAIATAILIGDRSGLSEADERRLQEAGTYHVIAISGGNIAILTGLLLMLLRALRVRPDVSAGVAIGVLLFYGEVASGGASVSRAITAASVFLGGRMLDHRGPALNALAVAAAAGLSVWPLAAFDGGFILSFGATLGILLGAPRVLRPRVDPLAPSGRHQPRTTTARTIGRIGHVAGALFVATLCAEIALAPAGAWIFSRITFAGFLLNFLAIPLMAVVQAGAMCTLAAVPIATRAADYSGYITHVAASGLVRSAELVAVAPWVSQDVLTPAWWLACAYYSFCAVLLTRRHARIGAMGVAAAAGLMLAPPPGLTNSGVPVAPPGVLRVVFLDVGQGDATLARMPDGRVLLVDAGGLPGSTFDIGGRVVGPALRAFGVRTVDTLVLTHGDPDHIGGAPAVLRRFGPRAIWDGVPVPPHAALREIAAQASAAGVSWRSLQAGDRETAGGVEIRILHPPPPEWERQRVRNEDSVVLELRFGDVSIVLPGDIGREAEQLLTPTLDTGPITIVKAPHHGSATSSTEPFVHALHPAAVIFSAGKSNRFGHPAPVVVARYRALHALTFRTDEDGAVVLDTDGRTVQMTTWSGRRITFSR